MRQYLLKSNKMRRRKQSIFDFNHIDPHIQEEELEEIKIFSDLSQKILVPETAHSRFKKMNLLMNCTSSGLIAIGAIAGGVTMNPHRSGVISGVGLIIKTAMEMKESEKQN